MLLLFISPGSEIYNPLRNANYVNSVKNYVLINPLTAECGLRAVIDFALSNARRFYLSMGNPLAGKGLSAEVIGNLCSKKTPFLKTQNAKIFRHSIVNRASNIH